MDIVLTVPKNFTHPAAPGKRGLAAWIAEGDAAGDPSTGQDWWFTTYGALGVMPDPDARCYVVCEDRLRGYAPLVKVLYDPSRVRNGCGPVVFIRRGGAVAVTVPWNIVGFRGWRHPWWPREEEIPFPNWKTEGRLPHPADDPKGVA